MTLIEKRSLCHNIPLLPFPLKGQTKDPRCDREMHSILEHTFLSSHVEISFTQPFLDKTRQQVTLIEKTMLSHDTFRFRLALSKPTMCLGLPVGKHIKVCQ